MVIGRRRAVLYFLAALAMAILSRTSRKYLWLVISVFIVALVIYAQQQLTHNPAKVYYSMPVRAFELLIGALISCLPKLNLPKTITGIGLGWSKCSICNCNLF